MVLKMKNAENEKIPEYIINTSKILQKMMNAIICFWIKYISCPDLRKA